MRLGIDGRKIPEAKQRGGVASMDHARQLSMDGVFFRTALDVAPTLDMGVLHSNRQRADELGMYLEMGLGKVNPPMPCPKRRKCAPSAMAIRCWVFAA